MNIESLIPFFSSYGILITFFCGIFGGEEVILTLVFLSAMGLLPLWWILVFTTIGEYISDTIIFSIGRFSLPRKIRRIEKLTGLYNKAHRIIAKVSRKNTALTLLYSKLIYGTRIMTLIYLGSKKTRWRDFLISEIFVMIIWMSITVTIGWFGGRSIKQISTIFKDIGLTIASLIVFIVLIALMKKWIQSRLLKRQKQ